jgi:NTP pyrophosphatase (non-canonical NTP hydrolase)
MSERSRRQARVRDWAYLVLSADEVDSREQRAIRLAEETIELAQACEVDKDTLHKLIDYVYSRPVGEPYQEFGGVSVCILAVANALCIDADLAEEAEVSRCEAMDPERFKARNRTKNEAGFIMKGRAI